MRKGKQRIAARWNSYARGVLAVSALPVRRIESRRAFYAGAAAMWREISDAFGPGGGGVEAMNDLMQEVRAFARKGGVE